MTQTRQPRGIPVGGEFAANDRDEAAVTLNDLAAQTPAEIDVPLSELYGRRQQISGRISALEGSIERWREVGYYADRIPAAEQEIGELTPQLGVLELESARLEAEFARRGGWSRFYLVIGGHVHASTECSTCFPTTQFAWLPDQSGKDEAEIVDAAGDAACTVCFPSAPVADPGQPRKNRLETAEQRNAREERAAAKAARDAKKAATAIAMPDGEPLRTKGWVNRNGTVSQGYEIATERTAEIELVGALVDQAWTAHWARVNPSDDPESLAHSELQKAVSDEFIAKALTALAHKRGQTREEVRAVVEKKAAAKLRKEGLTP